MLLPKNQSLNNILLYLLLKKKCRSLQSATTCPTHNQREEKPTQHNTLPCFKIQLVVEEMATETPLLLDIIEKAVDYKGRPVLRSNSGGWRSASFIIGKESTCTTTTPLINSTYKHGDSFAFFILGIKKYTCMMGLLYI